MLDKSFYIYTLGCKVNQYDSQLIREGLQDIGFVETEIADAQFAIINTCTVTGKSDVKSRKAVQKVLKLNPECRVIIIGCGQEKHQKSFNGVSGVVFIGGNDSKDRLVSLISELKNTNSSCLDINQFTTEHSRNYITSFGAHTRVFVKAQDGCNSSCAYCIIPSVRGRSKSRDIESVCGEITRLVEKGFLEIVLTGIHLGQFLDSNNQNLCSLLKEVIKIDGLKRLRLSSIEPQDISDEFIELFSSTDLIVPHLHLPLQNGDDFILSRMNRQYTFDEYMSLVTKLRSQKPDLLLTTDLIVGFPGETEGHFLNSLKNVINIGFSKVHLFPFSSRPGTQAEKMTDKITKKIIKQRIGKANEKIISRAEEIKKGFIGRNFQILVESKRDADNWVGFTPNYLKVLFADKTDCSNKLRLIKLTELDGEYFRGESMP